MSKTQHTPGPWEASEAGTVFAVPVEGENDDNAAIFVCDCADEPSLGVNAKAKANAEFIAAAPATAAERDDLKARLSFANECGKLDHQEKKALRQINADLLVALERAAVSMNCTESTFMHEESEKARIAISKAKGAI